MSTPSWRRPQREPNGDVIGPLAGKIHVFTSRMSLGGGGGGGGGGVSAALASAAANATTSTAWRTDSVVADSHCTRGSAIARAVGVLSDWAATAVAARKGAAVNASVRAATGRHRRGCMGEDVSLRFVPATPYRHPVVTDRGRLATPATKQVARRNPFVTERPRSAARALQIRDGPEDGCPGGHGRQQASDLRQRGRGEVLGHQRLGGEEARIEARRGLGGGPGGSGEEPPAEGDPPHPQVRHRPGERVVQLARGQALEQPVRRL